ncbi:hypothetical protein GFY24_08755 [Nocardia sp. SYP-A9097]|uniref:hypothetical protein n=1 Tax=Nocardia sp. SYP-A9097 TaxID=2663237 RepID=UPI00129A6A2E|nr:hypothetical protein [Nocardia sp. SYP-A9097]MRH87544.1 hypothetical protein [Nocardia sp. SYP-A9097]
MGMVEGLWAAGQMPGCDGLYRSDDTGLELYVDGPGEYHPDAGQPIPFEIGEPFDVGEAIAECGGEHVSTDFESPLPDGSGLMSGGGAWRMGNFGYLARLNSDGSLRWVAVMYLSNPFTGVRYQGMTAVFTNDWRNRLTLDLTSPALR